MTKTLTAIFLGLLLPVLAWAGLQPAPVPPANVSLAWNAVPAPVKSYNVYYGTASRNYTNVFNVGTNFATISNLVRGATYFVTVTSVSTNGLESPFSNEVSYTPEAQPSPPVIQLALNRDGTVKLLVKSEPYGPLRIWSTKDLRGWVSIGSVTPGISGISRFTDSLGSPRPARQFYRTTS